MSRSQARLEPGTGCDLSELESTPAADSAEAAEATPAAATVDQHNALQVLAMLPACGTARIHALEGDRIRLAIGGDIVDASRDPSVHPVVLQGALARGERVLAEHHTGEGWVVVGALRTQPSPGIDRAQEYTIEADRVHIRADSEIALTARASSLVLRAIGEVETYAERILSRAEGLHKIVGRMLRLN